MNTVLYLHSQILIVYMGGGIPTNSTNKCCSGTWHVVALLILMEVSLACAVKDEYIFKTFSEKPQNAIKIKIGCVVTE